MLEKIQESMRSLKLEGAEKAALFRELCFVNYRRIRIFAPVLLLAFLALAAVDLLNRSKGLWGSPATSCSAYTRLRRRAIVMV